MHHLLVVPLLVKFSPNHSGMRQTFFLRVIYHNDMRRSLSPCLQNAMFQNRPQYLGEVDVAHLKPACQRHSHVQRSGKHLAARVERQGVDVLYLFRQRRCARVIIQQQFRHYFKSRSVMRRRDKVACTCFLRGMHTLEPPTTCANVQPGVFLHSKASQPALL